MSCLHMKLCSLMKKDDADEGVLINVFKTLLSFAACIYGIAIKIIDHAYRKGWRKKYRSRLPVISIGNITLGGTGKTPFTIFAADHFHSSGKRVGVLIRGYGGDENKMLSENLPDVRVYTGRDRSVSAKKAENEKIDILLMDDGFQHRTLARDLDIVLLDSLIPFGNGKLFPRGILREPVSVLERADVIILTKADRSGFNERESLKKKIRAITKKAVIAVALHEPIFFKDVTGNILPKESIAGKKICTFSQCS